MIKALSVHKYSESLLEIGILLKGKELWDFVYGPCSTASESSHGHKIPGMRETHLRIAYILIFIDASCKAPIMKMRKFAPFGKL